MAVLRTTLGILRVMVFILLDGCEWSGWPRTPVEVLSLYRESLLKAMGLSSSTENARWRFSKFKTYTTEKSLLFRSFQMLSNLLLYPIYAALPFLAQLINSVKQRLYLRPRMSVRNKCHRVANPNVPHTHWNLFVWWQRHVHNVRLHPPPCGTLWTSKPMLWATKTASPWLPLYCSPLNKLIFQTTIFGQPTNQHRRRLKPFLLHTKIDWNIEISKQWYSPQNRTGLPSCSKATETARHLADKICNEVILGIESKGHKIWIPYQLKEPMFRARWKQM